MRAMTLAALCFAFAMNAMAQHLLEPRVEVDPYTKIEGGADLRGSGGSAGATTQQPDRENDRSAARPEKREPEEDKPVSERKPADRAPEEAVNPDRCLRGDARCVP
jgi:hypothetical protein